MINVKKEIISKRRVSRITSIHGTLKKNSHPERSERLAVIGKFLRNYFTLTIALKTTAVLMIGILQFLSNKHKCNGRKEKPFSNIDSKASGHTQGLLQNVFDIGIPILGTLIWACTYLLLGKNKSNQ